MHARAGSWARPGRGLFLSCLLLWSGLRIVLGRLCRCSDLEIVHDGLDALDGSGVGGCGGTFGIAADIAGEGDNSIGGLDRNLLALDRLVGINLALNLGGHIAITAGLGATYGNSQR